MKLRDRIGMNQNTPVVANSTTAARPAPNGRQATIDRCPHCLASRRKTLRCLAKRTNPGKNQHISL